MKANHWYWDQVKKELATNHGYSAVEAIKIVNRFEGEWMTQANHPEQIFATDPKQLAAEIHEDQIS